MVEVEPARRILDAISQDSSRTTGPLLRRLTLTLLPPLVLFLITMIAGGYLRVYLELEFQDSSLNTLTAISTSLLTLVVAWWAIRWTENRFHGLKSLRQLIQVLGSARVLEREMTSQSPGMDTEADAAQAWQDYCVFVENLGLTPPAADPIRE
ncbi:MAG: hypothetical protein K8L99_12655 [Anaerolineae bacterium]|nr:hypothetical protein [Anaerolineae bacterium]